MDRGGLFTVPSAASYRGTCARAHSARASVALATGRLLKSPNRAAALPWGNVTQQRNLPRRILARTLRRALKCRSTRTIPAARTPTSTSP